jgi:hypothetical protein
LCDLLEALRRHRHRGKRERTAQALGVVHRPETGQQPAVEQALNPCDHHVLGEAQSRADLGKGPLGDRKAALERVDQLAIERVHHAGSSCRAA